MDLGRSGNKGSLPLLAFGSAGPGPHAGKVAQVDPPGATDHHYVWKMQGDRPLANQHPQEWTT